MLAYLLLGGLSLGMVNFSEVLGYFTAGIALGFGWVTVFDILRHFIAFIASLFGDIKAK